LTLNLYNVSEGATCLSGFISVRYHYKQKSN